MKPAKNPLVFSPLFLAFALVGRGAQTHEDVRWDNRFAVAGAQGNVFAMAFDRQRTYFGGQMQSLGRLAANAVVEREGNHWRALMNGPQVRTPYFSFPLNVLTMGVFKRTLYVGGFFNSVGGMPAGGLASWDEHRWSVLGGTNGEVYILKADDHGLLVGGDFTLPGSTNRVMLARWDGCDWDVLSGTGVRCAGVANCPETVGDLEILGDDIIASVEWRDASGFVNGALARFDKNRQWSALPNPSGSASDYNYYLITKFRGQLVAGGEFSNSNNPALHNIALWNGTAWQPLGQGLPGYVMDIAGDDHSLYALHEAPTNSPRGYLVSRWDGTRWSALGTNYFEWPEDPFRLFVSPGGEVYVVGYFTGMRPIGAPNLIRWNGTRWEALFEGEYEGVAGDASVPLALAHMAVAAPQVLGRAAVAQRAVGVTELHVADVLHTHTAQHFLRLPGRAGHQIEMAQIG